MTGCQLQGKEPVDPDKKEVTIRDLYRAANSERKILVVDGWKDPNHGAQLRELLERSKFQNWDIVVKAHDQVTRDELSNTPTMLIGVPTQNSWMKELINQLPLKLDQGEFHIDEKVYDAESHAAVLSYYPNPLNVRMPLGIFISNNERLVWQLTKERITSFLRGNWNYEILLGAQRVLLGNFSQKPSDRWEFDRQQRVSLPTTIKHQWKFGSFHFNSYHEELNHTTVDFLNKETQRVTTEIQKICNQPIGETNIKYFLYPSTEIKGLMTGNTNQSHLNIDRSEVHTAFEDHFEERYVGKEIDLLINQSLGPSSHEVIRSGLAIYFTSQWQKQGYQYWAHHLIEGGNGLTVAQLMDPEQFNNTSSLIREALAGSLVDFLISRWGQDKFLENYKSWSPDNTELNGLNRAWWSMIKSTQDVKSVNTKRELNYLQGFNFTHEGYRIFNGYGSNLSRNSMEQLHQIGSNAVAIVPYSWMRDPKVPANFRFSSRAGAENDEGILHAICEAQQRDFYTVLKPHVWISNSWPGEVEMKSEEDWDKFFESYYRWISHYALMAEMQQVDMLSIGVEFSKATLEKEDRWAELIRKLRGIYSGNLIYAANWGEEFENISLWKHLDYIGLNCYYPLANKEIASQEVLVQGFKDILNKVQRVKSRFNKPVIFTEIGFRSIQSPWLQPHAEAGIKEFSERDQAIAYEAVFKALHEHPSIQGILWWKWPTNHMEQLDGDRRFVPSGKKAEKIVEEWFGKGVAE